MITKKIAIEGRWYNLYVFQEEESFRLEIEDNISLKRYKLHPDNKITIEIPSKEDIQENSSIQESGA